MSTIKKVAIFGLLMAAGVALMGKAQKAQKFVENIFVRVNFKSVNIRSLKINLNFNIQLTNYSGFTITPKNLYSKLMVLNSSNQWVEMGISSILPSLEIKNNQVTSFDSEFTLPITTAIRSILTGARKIKVTTNYDYLGQPLAIDNEMDLTAITNAIKTRIGLSGFMGVVELKQNSQGVYTV